MKTLKTLKQIKRLKIMLKLESHMPEVVKSLQRQIINLESK